MEGWERVMGIWTGQNTLQEVGKIKNKEKIFCLKRDLPKYYIIFVSERETCYVSSSSFYLSLQVIFHLSIVGFLIYLSVKNGLIIKSINVVIKKYCLLSVIQNGKVIKRRSDININGGYKHIFICGLWYVSHFLLQKIWEVCKWKFYLNAKKENSQPYCWIEINVARYRLILL